MPKKSPNSPKKITNRKARHDYDIASDLVAGIALNGRETKALRMGHGHLRGAYVTVKDNELWLLNATITGFGGVKLDEAEQTQSRKLLLKRREIDKLLESKQQGQAIIPLELLTGGRYIKLRIAVGRGRKHYDKREAIKKRDQTRANQQELKNYRS